jgi:tetratricopeptide (TPR) repeat protein
MEELLAHAIRIDPTNARAYVVRGTLYVVTKRTKEAKEAAQNAVRLNPSYASAYAQLAQDEVTPAEYPLAIANVEEAIKLSPRDPEMGRWHWINVEEAIKLSPRDPEMGRWHWIKGKTFAYMGRYQDAIREEQAALDSGYSAWPA